MLKKMTVLAMAVAALAAFAVPASASAALKWTANGTVVNEGVNISETFEGYYGFDTPEGSFGCQTKLKLTVTGPSSAKITEFSPILTTCRGGSGSYSECTLAAQSSNVPWTVINGKETLTATVPGGFPTEVITFGSKCAGYGSRSLQWSQFELIPKGSKPISLNPITSLVLNNRATAGYIYHGTMTPVGSNTLGLK